MQQHIDRRAAKRTAASLVVLFFGTRLTEALMTAVPHGTSAMRVSRGATRHNSQKSTAASADTVVGVPASSLVSSF